MCIRDRADSIRVPVSKAADKRWIVFSIWEKISNVLQRGDLEYLRFLKNHFSAEGPHKSVGTHNNGALRKPSLSLVLPQFAQIISSGVASSDSSCGQVEHLVSIFSNFGKQVADAVMAPIDTESRQDVAQRIRSGNCSINVRDDNLCVVIPQKDLAL